MEVDEVSLTDRQAYQAKMSKWCKDAVEALESPAFKAALQISLRVCRPLEHLSHFIQSEGALVETTGAGALANLVWGKGGEIHREFDAIQSD
eukprot:4276759-Lingulodinium_polyedra.AAC.1